MITLITGTPGAGKTLYCISKLLRDLVGSTVKKTNEDGTTTEIPRRILTNINGLLLEHELIGPDEGGGLADWHKWCKPGDVIVYDEVQRSWLPRANGAKVPDYISALETHRHMGVDFIILTQNPMLIDRNVLALTGRHLHVRRFGGLGAAIVYEWDHCSRSLLFSKSIAKHTFRYDKSVFKLYKSAELHTKPKITMPTMAIVVVLAVVGAAFMIPYAAKRIGAHSQKSQEKTSQKASEQTSPKDTHSKYVNSTPDAHSGDTAATTPPPEVQSAELAPFPLDTLTLAGSMATADRVLFLFQSPQAGGGMLQSDKLENAGYKVDDLGGCLVRVTFGNTSRVFVCAIPDKPKQVAPKAEPHFPRLPHAIQTADYRTAVQDGEVLAWMGARRR